MLRIRPLFTPRLAQRLDALCCALYHGLWHPAVTYDQDSKHFPAGSARDFTSSRTVSDYITTYLPSTHHRCTRVKRPVLTTFLAVIRVVYQNVCASLGGCLPSPINHGDRGRRQCCGVATPCSPKTRWWCCLQSCQRAYLQRHRPMNKAEWGCYFRSFGVSFSTTRTRYKAAQKGL